MNTKRRLRDVHRPRRHGYTRRAASAERACGLIAPFSRKPIFQRARESGEAIRIRCFNRVHLIVGGLEAARADGPAAVVHRAFNNRSRSIIGNGELFVGGRTVR